MIHPIRYIVAAEEYGVGAVVDRKDIPRAPCTFNTRDCLISTDDLMMGVGMVGSSVLINSDSSTWARKVLHSLCERPCIDSWFTRWYLRLTPFLPLATHADVSCHPRLEWIPLLSLHPRDVRMTRPAKRPRSIPLGAFPGHPTARGKKGVFFPSIVNGPFSSPSNVPRPPPWRESSPVVLDVCWWSTCTCMAALGASFARFEATRKRRRRDWKVHVSLDVRWMGTRASKSASGGRREEKHRSRLERKNRVQATKQDDGPKWVQPIVDFFDNPGDNVALSLRDIFSLTAETTRFSAKGRLVRLAFVLFGVANLIGLCWFGIGWIEGFPEDNAWTNQIRGSGTISSMHDYAGVFYWGFVLMSGFGPDILPPETPLETTFMIIAQILAITAYTTLLGNLVSVFEELRMSEAQFQSRMLDLSIWSEQNNLPEPLKAKIFRYEKLAFQRGLNKLSLSTLDSLPSHLVNEIVAQMEPGVVKQVPLFAKADASFQRAMLRICKPVLCLKGDYLIRQGEIGQEMYFVKNGRLDVIVNGRKVTEKHPGEYVGEISVVFAQPRTASVIAMEDTELLSISKKDFDELKDTEEYRDTFSRIREAARDVINERLQRSDLPRICIDSEDEDDELVELQSAAAAMLRFFDYLTSCFENDSSADAVPAEKGKETDVDLTDVLPGHLPLPATLSDTFLQLELQKSMTKLSKEIVGFDSFRFDSLSCGRPLTLLSFYLFKKWNMNRALQINETKLLNFLSQVEKSMARIPYHNAVHVTDVLQMYTSLLFRGGVASVIGDRLLLLSGFLAVLIHDFAHPGVNNLFLARTDSEMVQKYGECSTLEEYHFASAWAALLEEENFFLGALSPDNLETVRMHVHDLVLATDMARHEGIVNEYEKLLERFPAGLEPTSILTVDEQKLILKVVVKCSDLGHLGRPYSIHLQWVEALAEEFCQQGDMERSLGLEVGILNHRDQKKLQIIQPEFYSNIGIPLFAHMAKLFPKTKDLYNEARVNCRIWETRFQK